MLPVPANASVPAVIPDLSEVNRKAVDFARASKSPATLRAYEFDWADFTAWCESLDVDYQPCEPATVGRYRAAKAHSLKPSTISRRVAAITHYHRLAGLTFDNRHPAIAAVMSGIRRTLGAHVDKKTAILTEDLRAMAKACPDTLAGARDRAVLLVGFASACRRSELAALTLPDDIEINQGGCALTIRRSKTDQEGVGQRVGFPRSKRTCPVAALEQWLRLAAITDGPLFRQVHGQHVGGGVTGNAIAEIVKRCAIRAGFDPKKYAAHSLRSGFMTSASRGGADLATIMLQSRHKNADVARGYIQEGKLLENAASKAVRL